MEVLLLRDSIPWFGRHTGYEQLSRYLPHLLKVQTVSPRQSQVYRYAGSLLDRARGRRGKGASTFSEIEFHVRRGLSRPTVSHILYAEQHLGSLAGNARAPRGIVGTLHLPAQTWSSSARESLRRFSSAIVLY